MTELGRAGAGITKDSSVGAMYGKNPPKTTLTFPIFAKFLTHFPALYHPSHAVWWALFRAGACRMLIGPCDPMLCPLSLHVSRRKCYLKLSLVLHPDKNRDFAEATKVQW